MCFHGNACQSKQRNIEFGRQINAGVFAAKTRRNRDKLAWTRAAAVLELPGDALPHNLLINILNSCIISSLSQWDCCMRCTVKSGIHRTTSVISLFQKLTCQQTFWFPVCQHVAGCFKLVISNAMISFQIWFGIILMLCPSCAMTGFGKTLQLLSPITSWTGWTHLKISLLWFANQKHHRSIFVVKATATGERLSFYAYLDLYFANIQKQVRMLTRPNAIISHISFTFVPVKPDLSPCVTSRATLLDALTQYYCMYWPYWFSSVEHPQTHVISSSATIRLTMVVHRHGHLCSP